MPGFGGDPWGALFGSIPGAMVNADKFKREREKEELQRQSLEQAIRLAEAAEGRAQAGEGRTAELHPLTVEGAKLGNVGRDVANRTGEYTLGRSQRVDQSIDPILAGIADPNQKALSEYLLLSGQPKSVTEGVAPYGVGRTVQDEARDKGMLAEAIAAGGRRGAPPVSLLGGGGGVGGAGADGIGGLPGLSAENERGMENILRSSSPSELQAIIIGAQTKGEAATPEQRMWAGIARKLLIEYAIKRAGGLDADLEYRGMQNPFDVGGP